MFNINAIFVDHGHGHHFDLVDMMILVTVVMGAKMKFKYLVS